MAREMILLDTCILIELQRGNQDIKNILYQYQQDQLYITPVVIAEFYRGARNKQEFLKCKKLVSLFRILSIDHNVTDQFNSLFENYALSHRPSVPDMLIAATAMHYKFVLYTLNIKDFDFITELKLL